MDILSMLNLQTWDVYIVAFLVSLVIIKFLINRPPCIPGPWVLPLFGHLPFSEGNLVKQFQLYRERYGDIYALRLEVWQTVIIGGYYTVRKVLQKQSDSFASKPAFNSFKFLNNMKSLTFSYFDQRYLLHRKIGSLVIRNYSGHRSKCKKFYRKRQTKSSIALEMKTDSRLIRMTPLC